MRTAKVLNESKLIEEIEKAGYTASGLSKYLGMSRTVINEIKKNGTTRPGTAHKICNAIGLEFSEIFQIQQTK